MPTWRPAPQTRSFSPRPVTIRLATGLLLMALACLGLAPAASADETATATFNTAGAHTFTVPAGVNSISVELLGAAGGDCLLAPGGVHGGMGAKLSGVVPVTPGQVLSIGVAGRGADCESNGAGGVGGGGTGGSGEWFFAAGGGGASSVGATNAPVGFPSLLAVAGGGGGAAGFGLTGGDAGNPGNGLGPGEAGGAGAETEGGQGGTSECNPPGDAGSSLHGGHGGNGEVIGGGGGGAGYYGGGGGAGGTCSPGGSGGGGSSYVDPSATEVGEPTPTEGEAFVLITYAVPTIEVDPEELEFEEQAAGTVSPAQAITVTNEGSAPLVVSSVESSGSEYLATNHCHAAVEPEQSCTIDVRFAPQQVGSTAATLTIYSTAGSSPTEVQLEGKGVALESGEPGEAGARGETGEAGAKGETGKAGAKGEAGAGGENGKAGANGSNGGEGAAGPAGPAGAPGELPRSGVYECHKRRAHGRYLIACFLRVKGASASIAGLHVHAVLARGSKVFASWNGQLDAHGRIVMPASRRVKSGRYSLTLTYHHGRRMLVSHGKVQIG